MERKIIQLFNDGSKVYKNCPVIIEKIVLQKDELSNKVFAQIKYRNVGNKIVTGCNVSLHVFSKDGIELGSIESFLYSDLNAKYGDTFGSMTPVFLHDERTNSISVSIDKVIFEDMTECIIQETSPMTIKKESLSTLITDKDLLNLYKENHNQKCEYIPKKEEDFICCSCGSIYYSESAKCYNCGASFDELTKDLDFETLKNLNKRIKKKKSFKRIFLICCLAVLIAFSFLFIKIMNGPRLVIKDGVVIEMKNKDVTEVTIPDGVNAIGEFVFSDCQFLTSITIPDSVTKIGDYAFINCVSLKDITIPSNVTKIGMCTFENCSSLTNVTIPDGVIEIGHVAFADCINLSSITIPDSITKIGGQAFRNCENLKSITIPNGVKEIDDFTFNGCRSLTNVTIPDGVTKIGEYAFDGCYNITSITIPDSVTEIGNFAFGYCESLTSITIPPKVEVIAVGTFEDCKSLTSIIIPDGVIEIGGAAFDGCDNLTSVIIPSSVTKIGIDAFADFGSNYHLKITYKGTKKQFKKIDLSLLSGITIVKCTDGTINY